jgi:16S rRNA (guanine527-N7)-methyltransferase
VKQYDDLNSFISFLEGEGFMLSSKQQSQLKVFLEKLVLFSLSHRVVSRNDINFIVNKHFLSSFCFVKQINKTIAVGDNILDLGSGAGFPGILLSIFFNNNKVVLVDSVRKKTLFLKKMIKELGLYCDVVNMRIEDFKKVNPFSFRFVTARALASIDDLLELSSSYLTYGELHTIKGLDYSTEYTANEKYKFSEVNFSPSWVEYSEYLGSKVYLKIKMG